MKKVKITVLKTTFDEELAKEYGAEGLTACPMLKEGQVFLPIMPNQNIFVMRHGKQFINMFSHWLMVRETMFSITEIGSENPA